MRRHELYAQLGLLFGLLVTFGTRYMTQPNRTCYIIGYILMVSALPFW